MSSDFFVPTEDAIKLVTLFLLGALSILAANYCSFVSGAFAFFCWGTFLALVQLLVGISLSRDLGQHYLTLSLPLGCAAFYSARFLYVSEDTKSKRLFFSACFFINVAAIGTLLARSPIVFAAIFLIFLVAALIVWSRTALSALQIIGVTAIGGLIFYILLSYSSFIDIFTFRQLSRFDFFNGGVGQESRMDLYYIPALSYIQEKPLSGWGLGSSLFLYGSYPHNIFLEVLSIGGLLLFSPFAAIILIWLGALICAFRIRPLDGPMIAGIGIQIYTFLQFNTSFDLLSSYILMVPLLTLVSLNLRRDILSRRR